MNMNIKNSKSFRCDLCGKLVKQSRRMRVFDNPYYKDGEIHAKVCSDDCYNRLINRLRENPKQTLQKLDIMKTINKDRKKRIRNKTESSGGDKRKKTKKRKCHYCGAEIKKRVKYRFRNKKLGLDVDFCSRSCKLRFIKNLREFGKTSKLCDLCEENIPADVDGDYILNVNGNRKEFCSKTCKLKFMTKLGKHEAGVFH